MTLYCRMIATRHLATARPFLQMQMPIASQPSPMVLMIRAIRIILALPYFRLFGILLWVGISSLDEGASLAADESGATVRLKVGNKTTIGRLMEMNNQQAILLRRDGRMVEFSRQEIDDIEPISGFKPYTAQSLQNHYRKMFGKGYEVTRTRHYVVVHPPGMRSQWADPFDELYDRFQYYFSVRGFSMRPAEFPMIVVVFKTRSEFNRVARKDGVENPRSYAGYYSSESNWVVTYAGSHQGGIWESNATLIHEALHQFAFNHGIHKRWANTPQWCAEGLAAMFEARGVNNAREYRRRVDKLNPVYMKRLTEAIKQGQVNGKLKYLLASDRLFGEDIALAYSLSWGLAFYLAETHSAEFNQYLQLTAQRDRNANFTSSDRLADFAKSFGDDFVMLESHFTQFVKSLD